MSQDTTSEDRVTSTAEGHVIWVVLARDTETKLAHSWPTAARVPWPGA